MLRKTFVLETKIRQNKFVIFDLTQSAVWVFFSPSCGIMGTPIHKGGRAISILLSQ